MSYTTSLTINGWVNLLTSLRTDGYTGPSIIGQLVLGNNSTTAAYCHLTEVGNANPATAANGMPFSTDTAVSPSSQVVRYNVDLATTYVNTAGSIAIRAQVTTQPLSALSDHPYKTYIALLTQTSTNAPVATVLENTIGAIAWGYTSVGVYTATLTGAFTAAKTLFVPHGFIYVSIPGGDDNLVRMARTSANVVTLTTYSGGVVANAILSDTPVEIRVYN